MSVPSLHDATIRIKRLSDSGRYAEVIDLCSDVVALFPREWKFYYESAHAKMILGRRSEAIDDLSRALKIQDREPALFFFRGSWKIDAGDYVHGSEDLLNAIDAEANLGSSYYVESARFRRAIAFLHLAEFEKAKDEYNHVRPDLTAYVKGRMWSATEVLDKTQRRIRP